MHFSSSLDVEPVDHVVVADDFSGQLRVSLQERDGAAFEGRLRQGAQVEEAVLDLLKLAFVLRAGMPFLHTAPLCLVETPAIKSFRELRLHYPNRPVM